MSPPVGTTTRFFGRIEGAYDTVAAFVGTDAIPLIDLEIDPTLEFKKSREKRGTADLTGEIEGYRGGKYRAVAYFATNAAGTAPPANILVVAAFNATPTFPGANSTQYALATPDVPPSLQLAKHDPVTGFYEVINGADVEMVEAEWVGNGECIITFSGEFATYGWCYRSTTTATVNAAAVQFTLGATHDGKIGVNARIQIGADTNGGAGYLVTAVNEDTGVVTFAPALVAQQAGPPVVVGFTPTPAYAGAIQGGINCGLEIGGTSIGVISGKLSFKTGNRLAKKEASADRPTRVLRGEREITGEMLVYALDDEGLVFVGRAHRGDVHDIEHRIGPDIAGERWRLQTPAARINVTPIKLPETEEATAAMTWVARRSAANNDSMVWLLD